MRRLAPAGLLLAVSLIFGCVGPVDVVPRAVGITLGLVAWASGGPIRSWFALLVGVPLLLHAQSVDVRLAVLVCIGLAGGDATAGIGAVFAATALGWRLALEGAFLLRGAELDLSRLLSRAVGLLTSQRIDFGPSASGLELFVLFLLCALALRSSHAAFPLRRVVLAGFALLLFIALLPALGRTSTGVPFDALGVFNRANEHLAPSPQAVAPAMFRWSGALLAVFCWLLPAVGAVRRQGRPPRAGVAALAVVTLIALTTAHASGGARRPGDVVLLKSAALDMNVPEPGRFGTSQAGMFGLLPRYLELDGHRVREHAGVVSQDLLTGASVVIAALPTVPYEAEVRRALERFVRRGGSLLVLGDHTDLLGTMGPLNELTASWGIRFQFDSAFAAVRDWHGCLDAGAPALVSGTGIGTGASLRIDSGARPMIVGRYGLADAGDRSNAGRGANLGNYSYEAGEQLGDVTLAAVRDLGRGRVMAFGDTSPFQNLMLPSSYPFVASLLDDLARPVVKARGPALIVSSAAAGALCALALAGSAFSAGGLAAAVLASSLWAEFCRGPSPLDRIPGSAKVALVDTAHLNGYEQELWHEESIGGLIVNLERNGYLPLLVGDGFENRAIGPAALPVLVAPRRPLARAETLALASHLGRGGDVLVAAGAEQARAVSPLLSLYGLSLGSLPLGPVPILPDMDLAAYEAQRRFPQFRRAWPVMTDGTIAVQSLYRAFEHDVVVQAHPPEGRGRLLLIADADFLTDRVLESENGAWEGNVELLRRLLASPAAL